MLPEQVALVKAMLDTAVAKTGSTDIRLNEWECYQLMEVLGLKHAPGHFLPDDAESAERAQWARLALSLADARGRLFIKVCGRNLLHKTEMGGVRLVSVDRTESHASQGGHAEENANGNDDARAVQVFSMVEAIRGSVSAAGQAEHIEGYLACGFVEHRPNVPGQEVLLSLRQDPAFGPVVVIGVGGILTAG